MAQLKQPRGEGALTGSRAAITILVLLAAGAVMTTVLAIIWLLDRRPAGSTLLSISLLAELLLLPALVLTRCWRWEGTLRLIAAGRPGNANAEISRTTTALQDPNHRAKLAASLLRALNQAECWDRLPIATQPPQAARGLTLFRDEIEQVASLVRDANAAAPGLALLELSLIGGYGSILYTGRPRAVRETLWRIRFLLSPRGQDNPALS